jgi:hypothetical protein
MDDLEKSLFLPTFTISPYFYFSAHFEIIIFQPASMQDESTTVLSTIIDQFGFC